MRDTIKFGDDAFDMFKLDLSEHLSGTKTHCKTNTVNKSLRKMMERSSQLTDLKSSIKELSWKTREGLKHELPTLCDYCDCLAVISERIRLPYRSVYQCFGGSFGHYNALQGKFPITGRPRTSEVTYRYDFTKAGLKWTDFKGEVEPRNSHVPVQVKRSEKFRSISDELIACGMMSAPNLQPPLELASEVKEDVIPSRPMSLDRSRSPFYDPHSPVVCDEVLEIQDTPDPVTKKRKPIRSAFNVVKRKASTIKKRLLDRPRSMDADSDEPLLVDEFNELAEKKTCATDLMSLACCPRLYDEVPDV
jgi:hypothetical protein